MVRLTKVWPWLSFIAAEQQLLHNELRLIETDGGVRTWTDSLGIHELLTSRTPFIDVTAHPELPSGELPLSRFAADSSFPKITVYHDLVHALQADIRRQNLFDNLFEFSSFHTRFCKSELGLQSSLWLYNLILKVTAGRPDIDVRIVDHADWKQKSLIVHIEGTENPEDVVVIDAHLDSINLGDFYNGRAPGADDNGSGSVTLVEALRIISKSGFKPTNSLELHWYSAEEIWLLGSLDVFAEYAKRNVSVKAMLEQDMTGASNRYRGEVGDEIRLVTDNVSPKLTNYLKLLVTDYTDVPYTLFSCGYACSDFYSAYIHGYPAAFAMERANEIVNYPGFPRVGHNELDTIDRIDFNHVVQHVKLALAYLIELGLAKF